MHINLTYILPLLGVVQGIIIIVVMLQRKGNLKTANRLFAAIVGILTIATLGIILDDTLSYKKLTANQSLLLYTLPFYLIMFLGPMLWLYGRSLFEKDFRWSKKMYVSPH